MVAIRIVIVALFIAATARPYQAQSPDSFTPTEAMTAPRACAPAVLLQNGTVLFAGLDAASPASQVYDPASGRFSPAAALNEARSDSAALRLDDGRVLIVGGWNGAVALSS